MTDILNLNEGQSVKQLYADIDKFKSLKVRNKLKILGLNKYIGSIEPIDRFKLLNKLTEVKDRLKLEDFPYSMEQLSNFIALSELINLPILDKSRDIFQYIPSGGYSKAERNRRAAQKRRQMSEFNEKNRIARERILLLKAQQLKEKDIEKMLIKAEIFSSNDKQLTQGSINRIYHNFMAMRKNFNDVVYEKAGLADAPHIRGSKKLLKTLDLKAMGPKSIKRFNEILTLKFTEQGVPDHDFYLCFASKNERDIVETLYINKHYLDGLELSIDIKVQTILSPGRYLVLLCTDPENVADSTFAKFTCDLYRQFIEIENIRFVRNAMGEILPFYAPPLPEAGAVSAE